MPKRGLIVLGLVGTAAAAADIALPIHGAEEALGDNARISHCTHPPVAG